MTMSAQRPIRQSGESDILWRKRATKYIRRYAPKSQRYYIRNGKRGNTKDQWIVPIFFVIIAVVVFAISVTAKSDLDTLAGSSSTEGTFTVSSISEHVKRRGGKSYSPNIQLRGETVNVYNSSGHDFAVGEPITIRYTTDGEPIASFTNSDGEISTTATYVGFIISGVFVVLGVLTKVLPRGKVAQDYMERALAELEAGRGLPVGP